MQHHDPQALAVGLLSAGRALVDGISAGVQARGFDDLRPAHGFAFARLAPDGATITQLAEHLGVTRQAAAQPVDGCPPAATSGAAATRTTRGPG